MGKPAWGLVAERDIATVQAAFRVAWFERKTVEYVTHGGLRHDMREWRCRLQPIENVAFVCEWHEKPLHAPTLTARERDVLLAICADEPPKATAKRLGISTSTVETHRAHLKQKTGAKGTAGLVLWAVRMGFVQA